MMMMMMMMIIIIMSKMMMVTMTMTMIMIMVIIIIIMATVRKPIFSALLSKAHVCYIRTLERKKEAALELLFKSCAPLATTVPDLDPSLICSFLESDLCRLEWSNFLHLFSSFALFFSFFSSLSIIFFAAFIPFFSFIMFCLP